MSEQGASSAPEAAPGATEDTAREPKKLPYEPPRIERRIPIVANTLVSGDECVFPGSPCE